MIWFLFGSYCYFSVSQFDFHYLLNGFLLFFIWKINWFLLTVFFQQLIIVMHCPSTWWNIRVVFYAFQFEQRISFERELFSLVTVKPSQHSWVYEDRKVKASKQIVSFIFPHKIQHNTFTHTHKHTHAIYIHPIIIFNHRISIIDFVFCRLFFLNSFIMHSYNQCAVHQMLTIFACVLFYVYNNNCPHICMLIKLKNYTKIVHRFSIGWNIIIICHTSDNVQQKSCQMAFQMPLERNNIMKKIRYFYHQIDKIAPKYT